MREFLDKDFLLKNDTAVHLYHDIAENLPIIDYHCHISPKDIAEDIHYENIAQVWLDGDHYKWRAMRSNAVDENYITGNASDYDRFAMYALTIPKLIGNPLYHWSHLELKRYFNIDLALNEENCNQIWNICNDKLKDLSVRQIISKSNVQIICTTDDPIDDLKYHKIIKEDETFKTKVLPAFRPDKALNIDSKTFTTYIQKLSEVCNVNIKSIEDLKNALYNRILYFNINGCKASDHAFEYIPFEVTDKINIDKIFRKALNCEELAASEIDAYKTYLIQFLAEQYSKLNWVMELHYGVIRNINSNMYSRLGPDTGFDSIGSNNNAKNLAKLLDNLEKNNSLPKTILFSIDPSDNAMIGSIIGCFQSNEAPCKIQQGSAWWFNDTKTGMVDQLTSFANLSVLGNFIGFPTDSRCFLSYTRHEYFRRILCNFIGEIVENGEYPHDTKYLHKLITDISYNNIYNYFNYNYNIFKGE